MSVHTPVNIKGIYFITFTCFKWLPLIQITNSYDLIYKWFDILKTNGNPVLGYVIMPNHVHLLMYYDNNTQSLNTIVGNGKRFVGYEIIKRLEQKGEACLLQQMQEAVKQKDRQRNKKHQIWQGSFDSKQCRTEKFILQKLNYIHNNPERSIFKSQRTLSSQFRELFFVSNKSYSSLFPSQFYLSHHFQNF